MYDDTLYRERKYFCCHCLQACSIAEILKRHLNNCFKINSKQMIKMSKKGEYVRFQNSER